MPVQSLMMLEMGFDQAISCRHISEWFKMDSYVPSIEGLLAEIERNNQTIEIPIEHRMGWMVPAYVIVESYHLEYWVNDLG